MLHQVAVQPAQDATEQAQGQSVEEAAGRCFFLHVLRRTVVKVDLKS